MSAEVVRWRVTADELAALGLAIPLESAGVEPVPEAGLRSLVARGFVALGADGDRVHPALADVCATLRDAERVAVLNRSSEGQPPAVSRVFSAAGACVVVDTLELLGTFELERIEGTLSTVVLTARHLDERLDTAEDPRSPVELTALDAVRASAALHLVEVGNEAEGQQVTSVIWIETDRGPYLVHADDDPVRAVPVDGPGLRQAVTAALA